MHFVMCWYCRSEGWEIPAMKRWEGDPVCTWHYQELEDAQLPEHEREDPPHTEEE